MRDHSKPSNVISKNFQYIKYAKTPQLLQGRLQGKLSWQTTAVIMLPSGVEGALTDVLPGVSWEGTDWSLTLSSLRRHCLKSCAWSRFSLPYVHSSWMSHLCLNFCARWSSRSSLQVHTCAHKCTQPLKTFIRLMTQNTMALFHVMLN